MSICLKPLSFIAAFLFLSSCGGTKKTASPSTETPQTLVWTISDQRVDCKGVAPRKCYLYKVKGEVSWQKLYSSIQGFEPEPGYSYEIELKRSIVENPAADASAFNYSLMRIISQTEVKSMLSLLNDSYGVVELYSEAVPRSTSMLLEIQARNSGLVIGNSGCNGFRGELTLLDSNSGAVRFGPIAATEMYCDGKMELEINFFKALGEVTHIQSIRGGMQLLKGKSILLTAMRID